MSFNHSLELSTPPLIHQTQKLAFHVKQVNIATRLLFLTQPINIFVALLLCLLFFNKVDTIYITALTATICVLSLLWAGAGFIYLKQSDLTKNLKTMLHLQYLFSFLVASVFSIYCGFLFALADINEKLIITALYTGMICGGAFALSTLPRAAVAWVIPFSISGSYVMLVYQPSRISIPLVVLIVIYTGLMICNIFVIYQMFIKRLIAESEVAEQKVNIERQKEMVSLLLRDFEDHVNDWLWELNSNNQISYMSHKQRKRFQILEQAQNAIDIEQLFLVHCAVDDCDQTVKVSLLLAKLAEKASFTGIVVPAHVNGTTCWYSLTAKPLYDSHNQFCGWRGFSSDITKDYLHRLESDKLANYDALTHLPNRYYFDSFTNSPDIKLRPYAMLLIDLDNFKQVNDTLGHAEGDRLLATVAHRLKMSVNPNDFLARLGGDEFVLVSFTPEQATETAQLILSNLQSPCQLSRSKIDIKASIGISLFSPNATKTIDPLIQADMAMYRAKSLGKNHYLVFNKEIEDQNLYRIDMQDSLKHALSRNEFSLMFQPKIDTQHNKVVGLEALLRWTHPTKGNVSPAEFIPFTEELGIIVEIGNWVLLEACKEALKWPADIHIAVNVSGIQLESNFVEQVEHVLKVTGLAPHRLEIELTESAIIDNITTVNPMLIKLRALGISIALDDFGTGFSSLAYLQKLSINTLKIDRAFVIGLTNNTESAQSVAIINVIAQLSRALHLSTVIEGVENIEQLDIVKQLGCHDIQGYLFSKPLTALDALQFIATFNHAN